jgi:hypothetical protein
MLVVLSGVYMSRALLFEIAEFFSCIMFETAVDALWV